MSAAPLALRCANHPARQAVSKCLSCGNFFCRECVTEHEGRLLCAACVSRDVAEAASKPRRYAALGASVTLTASLIAAWLFFLTAGHLLRTLAERLR